MQKKTIVSTSISPQETMMDGDLARYLGVGADALKSIVAAMGSKEPESILDLPCGHGRVARHLRVAYPEADLFVADIDEPGAEFCASEFGATKLSSATDFDEIDFARSFDLIWVGSLITHLNDDATSSFLRFVARHLCSNGRAMVTSHGAFVAGRLVQSERSKYGLEPAIEAQILADYLNTGYGYRDYPNQTGYGISITSRTWLSKASDAAGLKVVMHTDHAWDKHQDVLVLKLAGTPSEA